MPVFLIINLCSTCTIMYFLLLQDNILIEYLSTLILIVWIIVTVDLILHMNETSEFKIKNLLGKIKIMKKQKIILSIIFIIGILVRCVGIGNMPNALNADEASSGYEAWSILNYGIDRNGKFLPAFLISWGSGQNALYTYLMIPFVKTLGLNILSVRLPMSIIGIISLFVMYFLLKRLKDEKIALIGLSFFAICPWHIMKSRWGLESNIFPDLILWAVYLLVIGLQKKKKVAFYLSAFVFGLTAYSYGTAYFFLPLFLIPLLIYLIKQKEIKIYQAIIFLGIVGIVSLPIIIFVLINTFDLPEITLPFLTIPRMVENRYESLTTIFKGNVFVNTFNNFCNSISIFILQNDKLPWSALNAFGIIYMFSLPLTIIGIIKEFKQKENYSYIFKIWFIVSFLILCVCDININRGNIFIIPMIYYTIIGIAEISSKITFWKYVLIISYIISFITFEYNYCHSDWSSEEYYTFVSGVEDVIEYVDKLENVNNIYFPYNIKEPYIYTLFYTKTDPHIFIDTVQKKDENGTFENIKGFGKYHFYDKIELNYEKENIYVIDKNQENVFDDENWNVEEFEKYLVVRVKE